MIKENPPILVLLSHDVDWGRAGPPIGHVLARKERFDTEVLDQLHRVNPYQNIPDVLDLEDGHGVRSTFFFRTQVKDSKHAPPPYDVSEYKSDIRSMISQGWEVGLHSDPASSKSLERLRKEKIELEAVSGTPVYGNRVHYTLRERLLFRNLKKLGFKYDSSVKHNRDAITREDFGYFVEEDLIVFPITIMDSLIFQYNVKTEDQILKVIRQAVYNCEKMPKRKKIMTLIWHDCSLKMKFGRRYPDVLEYLVSRKNLSVMRGIDLATMIERGKIS